MALNIKNPRVERLAREVAAVTGETKTEAIRRALEERQQRLTLRRDSPDRHAALLEFLEREIWPAVPKGQLGKATTRKEREAILGYGPAGV